MSPCSLRFARPLLGFGVCLWLVGVVPGQESGGAEPAAVLRMGVLTDNYPHSFRDDDGQLKGFAYELMSELEEVMGMKLERVVGTTAQIHGEFRAGRIDILQSFAHSKEREREVDFSFPYLTMAGAVFMRADARPIGRLEDLRDLRVMVHRGSLGEEVLRREGLADAILYVDSIEQALFRLERGEGDALLATRLTGLALAHRHGLRRVRALDMPVRGYEVRYCIATQKGERELLARLNEGLAILVRTERYDRLYQKWFGHVMPARYTKEEVMLAVLVGLALALAIAVWAAWRQREMRCSLVLCRRYD